MGLGVVNTFGSANVGQFVGPALDAARVGAICSGHPGAIYFGRTLLQSRLARAQSFDGQYGFAGCIGHQRWLDAVGLAVVDRTRRP